MVNIFNYSPVGDVTHKKAVDNIFDYRPFMCYVIPAVSEASLHNGYIVLHLLGNKATISCLCGQKSNQWPLGVEDQPMRYRPRPSPLL